MSTDLSRSFPDADTRWAAVCRRDALADHAFWFAVRTTGVYCRPSCPARRARRENVLFFHSPAAAERAGYRACRRCAPKQLRASDPLAAAVAAACRMLDAASVTTPRLQALAQRAGYSASHLHRAFRRSTGLTPRQYAEAARFARLRGDLEGDGRVIDAIAQAGFSSPSRAYDGARRHLGTTPAAYRRTTRDGAIRYAVRRTPLGFLLVAVTGKGVCAVELGDRRRDLEASYAARHPLAQRVARDAELLAHIDRVVAFLGAPAGGLQLPLDIAGTAFQHRVWAALMAIPPGRTISYGELAAAVGAPRSARAVARACAINPVALAVPCHRVVASDGALAGYRWGIERKAQLIAGEANTAARSRPATTTGPAKAAVRGAKGHR
jgi:AraC family transcriptional regulator of adaptative response/methylated-DNA-[protein]-cysteine methyltransferase